MYNLNYDRYKKREITASVVSKEGVRLLTDLEELGKTEELSTI